MKIETHVHDDGYRINAENVWGEKAELVLPADHPVSEYITEKGRLNSSYLSYWLNEQPSTKTDAFLAFLTKGDDHHRKRRVTRPKGWRDTANIRRPGDKPDAPRTPQKDGDVVVFGHHAKATMTVTED
jgi:hypothetical protein